MRALLSRRHAQEFTVYHTCMTDFKATRIRSSAESKSCKVISSFSDLLRLQVEATLMIYFGPSLNETFILVDF